MYVLYEQWKPFIKFFEAVTEFLATGQCPGSHHLVGGDTLHQGWGWRRATSPRFSARRPPAMYQPSDRFGRALRIRDIAPHTRHCLPTQPLGPIGNYSLDVAHLVLLFSKLIPLGRYVDVLDAQHRSILCEVWIRSFILKYKETT